MGRLRDLTGLKFGLLSVVNRAETINKKTMWRVYCDCGKEKIVRGESLINGSSKSCGCSSIKFKKTKIGKKYNLVNRKFGNLWVLWRVGSVKYGKEGASNSLWECQCICGKLIKVTGKSLRQGTISCGCINKKVGV